MTSQLDLLDLLQISDAAPAVKNYPCVGYETADQYQNECFPHIDTQWGSEEQMAADAERMASYRGMPIIGYTDYAGMPSIRRWWLDDGNNSFSVTGHCGRLS
jgi:hypothetical protein